MTRGYFGIGIVGNKTEYNLGTLWRSAHILGASFIFVTGRRYKPQSTDTTSAWKHTPLFQYETPQDLMDHIPRDCVPIAVEIDDRSRSLLNYVHPERAVYILGAEDTGLPKVVLDRCRDIVQLPGSICLNVASVGSIVMYDRFKGIENGRR